MIKGTQGQDQQIAAKPPLKWRNKLIGSVIIITSAWLATPTLSNWYSGIRSIERSSLLTARVFGGELVRDIAVAGKLVAASAPQLYSSERGKITIFSKPGDKVESGGIVARVDSPELTALIKQQLSLLDGLKIDASRGQLSDGEARLDLERGLDAAKVRLNAANRESERARQSYSKQVISELDYVKSQDVLLEAQLFHSHALKRIALTKKRLAFEQQTREQAVKRQRLVIEELQRRQGELAIRAPVTGIVGNWLVTQKELVSGSQALMTIVDLSQYEAELNVPEFYADDLGIGLQVNMTIAGKNLSGTISSISPEVNNNQVRVRVNIPSSPAVKLRQNQRLNARIEFERKKDVLMVKRGGFLQSAAGKSAFVINENTASRQAIVTGSSSVEFIEIVSGAKAGDVIIISDYQEFKDNKIINLVD